MHKRKVAQYLRKYVRNFNADQISSRFLEGEVELRNVELEIAPIAAALVGLLPYTLEIRSVSCEGLLLRIPWRSLRSKPLQVQVAGCRASVEVHAQEDEERKAVAAQQPPGPLAALSAPAAAAVKPGDLKVVIVDGLEISISSVSITVLSAVPRHQPMGCPVLKAAEVANLPLLGQAEPVWEVTVTDVSFGPIAGNGRKAERPGSNRDHSSPGNPLRRQLSVGSVQLKLPQGLKGRCSEWVGAASSGVAVVNNIAVSLLECRFVSPSKDPTSKKNAQMSSFSSEDRVVVRLPSIDVRCCTCHVVALAALAVDAAAPPWPPGCTPPPAPQKSSDGTPARGESKKGPRRRMNMSPLSAKATFSSPGSPDTPASASSASPTPCSPDTPTSSGTADISTKAMKTAASAGRLAQSASVMAQRSATSALSTAGAMAGAASSSAMNKAEAVAGAVANAGATAGKMEEKAKMISSLAKGSATKAATGALASANAMASRAASGARLAERTAGAAGSMGKQALGAAASTARLKERTVAASTMGTKALGAAGSLLRSKGSSFKMPWGGNKSSAAAAAAPAPAALEAEQLASPEGAEHAAEPEGGDEVDCRGIDLKLQLEEEEEAVQGVPFLGDEAGAAPDEPRDDEGSAGAAEEPPACAEGEPTATEGPPQAEPSTADQATSVGASECAAELESGTTGLDTVEECEDEGASQLGGDGNTVASDSGESRLEDLEEELDDADADTHSVGTVTSQGNMSSAIWSHAALKPEVTGVLLRQATIHVSIGSVGVEVRFPSADDSNAPSLVFDAKLLDATAEIFRRLRMDEARCIEELQCAPPGVAVAAATAPWGEGAGAAAVSANFCATAGALGLRVAAAASGGSGGAEGGGAPAGNHELLSRAEMAGGAPWLLTVRGSSCCLPGMRPRVEACLHGVRVHLGLEVIGKLKDLAESLGQLELQSVAGAAATTDVSPRASAGVPDVCDLAVTCRNLAVDLPPLPMGQPLRFILPRIDVSTARSSTHALPEDAAPVATYLSPPPVPLWHAEPPAGGAQSVEPDFTVYGCVCQPGASASMLGGLDARSVGPGGTEAFLTERQFRVTSTPPPPPVALPEAEVQRLLSAKLRASELMSEREELAEALHARSVKVVAREKQRRLPLVQELLEDFPDSAKDGPIAAQLNNLEAEARDLEEQRRAAEASWRALGREVGREAAAACAESLGREAELRQQLAREQAITAALDGLVEWQASQIAVLQRLQEKARASAGAVEAEG